MFSHIKCDAFTFRKLVRQSSFELIIDSGLGKSHIIGVLTPGYTKGGSFRMVFTKEFLTVRIIIKFHPFFPPCKRRIIRLGVILLLLLE